MGASHLVTGSVAATLYGEPRATHDIDLVVELSAANQLTLPRVFPAADFYLPPPEVVRRECERSGGGRSLKHLRDIRSMLSLAADLIDRAALEDWVRRRGLDATWSEVRGS
jgi:hypothetical protein